MSKKINTASKVAFGMRLRDWVEFNQSDVLVKEDLIEKFDKYGNVKRSTLYKVFKGDATNKTIEGCAEAILKMEFPEFEKLEPAKMQKLIHEKIEEFSSIDKDIILRQFEIRSKDERFIIQCVSAVITIVLLCAFYITDNNLLLLFIILSLSICILCSTGNLWFEKIDEKYVKSKEYLIAKIIAILTLTLLLILAFIM